MAALDLVIDGLADVVEQAAAPGQGAVQAEFIGHDLAEEGDLHAVLEDVLAVAGAVAQAPQQVGLLAVEPAHVGVHTGLLAALADGLGDLLADFGDDLLDAGGVDAAVGDELLEGQAGDLAADGVKGADHHHAGGIVHDHVHAGGLLESPDVAAFAADDAALHVVGGDVHGADGAGAGVLGGIALDGGDDDLAAAVLGGFLGLVEHLLDQGPGVVLDLVLDAGQQHVTGVFDAHPADPQELAALLFEGLGDLDFFLGDGRLALLHALLALVELTLFAGQGVELLVQVVFALLQPALGLLEFFANLAALGFEIPELGDAFLLGVDLAFFNDDVGLVAGLIQQPAGLLAGGVGTAATDDGQQPVGGPGTDEHADDQEYDLGCGVRHGDDWLHVSPSLRSMTISGRWAADERSAATTRPGTSSAARAERERHKTNGGHEKVCEIAAGARSAVRWASHGGARHGGRKERQR